MHANPVDSHHEVENLLPTESNHQSTSFTQSSHVHFLQRSQSLPAPSSADLHHGITRIRYLSGKRKYLTSVYLIYFRPNIDRHSATNANYQYTNVQFGCAWRRESAARQLGQSHRIFSFMSWLRSRTRQHLAISM
jgi:hypothetical protein